jgi:hypothetical protein
MPVFTIQTPAGKQLDIEAPDKATALSGAQQWHAQQQPSVVSGDAPSEAPPARTIPFGVDAARSHGYSDEEIVNHLAERNLVPDFKIKAARDAGYSPTEILNYLSPQPSGVVDSLRQGTADVMNGVGQTMETHLGNGPVGTWLQDTGKSVAPENYTPAPIIDKSGVHPSNIPAWLAKQAPAAAGVILAAGMAPEALGAAGAVGAGAGAGWLMSAGNAAKEAAVNRTGDPNATPTTADVTRGDLTAAGQSVVGALPVTRYLSGAGTLAKTGTAGAVAALKKLTGTATAQSAASAGQDVVGQVGQSIATPGGVHVDPTQVADSAAGGALTGTLFGGRNAARETLNAAKYRNITPDLQEAATQFANRMQSAADGANLKAGVIGGGAALRTGAEVFNKAAAAVHDELSDAVTDLRSRVSLPTDADNILNAAQRGQQPSAKDYAALTSAVQGDPQAANVMNLVRQAHVADIVKDTGSLSDKKFVGGASSLPTLLNAHTAEKAGLTALMAGAAIEGGAGHLISYSPEAIAALAGVAGAARIADKLTGARSPAGRFVDNFADGQTPVRLNVTQPQQPAPVVRPGPTGPRIAPAATPWGPPPPSPQTVSPQQKQQIIANAMPLLKQLAATNKPQPVPLTAGAPMAGGPGTPPMIPPAIKAQMDARANIAKLAAAQAEPQAPAPSPDPAINPLALPSNITGPASTLMRGAALAQKLRAAQARDVPASAPAIEPLALPKNVTGPAANIMRGAALAQKLRDGGVPENTQAAAQSPEPVSVSKADGMVSVDNGAGKVPVAPYANLSVPEAASRILADARAANVPIKNAAAFLTKTISLLNTVRDKVQGVTQAVPSIPAVEVARFEGVKTQKQAAAYRDHLKREYPQAADALDRVFSDDAIAGQWAQKR